jgi:lysylphosphatidylglycerol synthetase-like protein (DUF2156 family)
MTDPDLEERAARADTLEHEVIELRSRLAIVEAEHRQLVLSTTRSPEEITLAALYRDAPLSIARGLLAFLGAWACLAGLMVFVTGVYGGLTDPRFIEMSHGLALAASLAGAVSLVFFAYGAAAFLARRGLNKGTHQGWVTALIVFCLSLLFGCLPVGFYGLYALLRAHVRRAYFPV